MIYELQDAPAAYPMITSAGTETPLGWGALSGLAADPTEAGKLYAVSDSVYGSMPMIYTIDATQVPAKITKGLLVSPCNFGRIEKDVVPVRVEHFRLCRWK